MSLVNVRSLGNVVEDGSVIDFTCLEIHIPTLLNLPHWLRGPIESKINALDKGAKVII